MRLLILLLLLAITNSCSKKKELLNSDYKYFVGEWKNINGSQNIYIEFNNNGKSTILKDYERDITFRISSFQEKIPSEDGWKRFEIRTFSKNHLEAYINTSKDTAWFSVGSSIDNGVVQYSDCFGNCLNGNIFFVKE